jgi:RNA polymerase sigma factor (sigma-70 family)
VNHSALTNTPPPGQVSEAVEHLFRSESGRIVSTLVGIFGVAHINLAEDVVQDALVRALETWPYYGIPENPPAWILRVARNLALDVVRRQKTFQGKEAEIAALIELRAPADDASRALDQQFEDDRLRMMFVCCHPEVPRDAQVALALNILCGFGMTEVASAFLTSEAAIAKRLVRAKQKLREAGIAFEIPAGPELSSRLDSVLQTLYLLFNEGHKASIGDRLVRAELCHEAIRLAGLLAEHPAGNQPKTHALLALMLLNAARLPARVDDEGHLLRLQDQDRAKWDRAMSARGMFHLARSACGSEITEYHLQAGIAACHCAAPSYEATDWPQILSLYDRLVEFDASPVVALNRAVAVANVHGPQAGLDALAPIRGASELESYYLLYAVAGELESRLNRHSAAATHFRKSLKLARVDSEQAFLTARLRSCEDRIAVATSAPVEA